MVLSLQAGIYFNNEWVYYTILEYLSLPPFNNKWVYLCNPGIPFHNKWVDLYNPGILSYNKWVYLYKC